MKSLIIILFLLFYIASADFASTSLLEKVEKKYNKFAKNRFVALNNLLQKLQNADAKTKLEKINDFFNGVKYGDDKDIYGIADYWASPYEFLARDKGDCEDYAIAKFFALKHLGIPTSKMFLSYVKVKGATDTHMVLGHLYIKVPNATCDLKVA